MSTTPVREFSNRSEITRAVIVQLLADFLEEGVRNLPSVIPYLYSLSIFGLPARYIVYGAALSATLCLAIFNPIVSHYSFVATRGFGREATRGYLTRYWSRMSALFFALLMLGGWFSYIFRSDLVFQ